MEYIYLKNNGTRSYKLVRIFEISRSEEFHFGDFLNLMQDEIESNLDQIELNIGKT